MPLQEIYNKFYAQKKLLNYQKYFKKYWDRLYDCKYNYACNWLKYINNLNNLLTQKINRYFIMILLHREYIEDIQMILRKNRNKYYRRIAGIIYKNCLIYHIYFLYDFKHIKNKSNNS